MQVRFLEGPGRAEGGVEGRVEGGVSRVVILAGGAVDLAARRAVERVVVHGERALSRDTVVITVGHT